MSGRRMAERVLNAEGGATMGNLGRGCIAGVLASNLGGGIIGTIILFIIIYWALGFFF
jgi:hypothetical protein